MLQALSKDKQCIHCKDIFPLHLFNKDKTRKDGLNPRCKACYKKEKRLFYEANRERILNNSKIAYHENVEEERIKKNINRTKNREKENLRLKIDRKMNPLKYKNYTLTRDFGINLEDFEKMNSAQNGVCKICKKHNKERYKYLAVDHCHTTNKIRGLLCENCNKGIGMFHDNTELLNSAINYLKENI